MNKELLNDLLSQAVQTTLSEFATERIKVSMQYERASGEIIETVYADIPHELLEKFSELIVNECAKIADETQFKTRNYPVSIAIENHFGVK